MVLFPHVAMLGECHNTVALVVYGKGGGGGGKVKLNPWDSQGVKRMLSENVNIFVIWGVLGS